MARSCLTAKANQDTTDHIVCGNRELHFLAQENLAGYQLNGKKITFRYDEEENTSRHKLIKPSL